MFSLLFLHIILLSDLKGPVKGKALSYRTLDLNKSHIYSLAFSEKGHLLAGASSDNSIKIWETKNYELVRTLNNHTDPVYSVAFSKTGLLASGSLDNSVKIWNPENGELLRTLNNHTRPVFSVAFSETGGRG